MRFTLTLLAFLLSTVVFSQNDSTKALAQFRKAQNILAAGDAQTALRICGSLPLPWTKEIDKEIRVNDKDGANYFWKASMLIALYRTDEACKVLKHGMLLGNQKCADTYKQNCGH